MNPIARIFQNRKWSLTLRILPLVLVIIAAKVALYYFGLEIISSNPYLPSMVAAVVFLIGFLLTGVLSDYKESEKLPGEIACSLEAMADEAYLINKSKRNPAAKALLANLLELTRSMHDWFYHKVRTRDLMRKLRSVNDNLAALEPHASAGSIGRIKAEQNNLRKILTRIHTIKDTSFIASGYAIAEGIAGLLIIAMLLTKLTPFFESMFFVIPVVYLFVYMIALIKDLDNPFEYKENGVDADEVSLKEVADEIKRLEERLAEF